MAYTRTLASCAPGSDAWRARKTRRGSAYRTFGVGRSANRAAGSAGCSVDDTRHVAGVMLMRARRMLCGVQHGRRQLPPSLKEHTPVRLYVASFRQHHLAEAPSLPRSRCLVKISEIPYP
uniref:Uncharacterized protein n=1 Tax=Chlamydomonas euryale TaxID=1486919 RepID=A0A6U2HUC2_9CHLO|eukprot:365990-Chlamydomonas_euryale.AAC.10